MTEKIKAAQRESEKQTAMHKDALEQKDAKIKELQVSVAAIEKKWLNTSANREETAKS